MLYVPRRAIVIATVLLAAVAALLATATAITSNERETDSALRRERPVGAIDVMQMNLCGALGCYGEGVADRFEVVGYAVDQIAKTTPDLVMLNEVCFDQVDGIVRELEESWPMSTTTVATLAKGNGCAGHAYGNAVLHRGTLVGEQVFDSCEVSDAPCLENPPVDASGEQRAMVCVTVRLPGVDRPITGCSVHLVPRGDQQVGDRSWDDWNDRQVRSLQRLAAGELGDDRAVLIGGDFNAGPGRVLDGWPTGWTELDRQRRGTRPVPEPRRKIDFVMLSPEVRRVDAELLSVETCPSSRADGQWCTDHVPLAGTVAIVGS